MKYDPKTLRSIKNIVAPLMLGLAIYTFLSINLQFTQDDAFISYRYVANFLNGHGLVYNIGERIEGFTNFGWVILLSSLGSVGIDYIATSKFIGFILGGGILVLTFMIARLVFQSRFTWLAILPLIVIAFNRSLAYWASAGLETSAFGFLSLLSLYYYLRRSRLLVASLFLAVWIRPEGALIAALLIVTEALVEKQIPRFSLRCSLIALLLSMPYVIFKLGYYGSILPLPFHAKTGWDINQLRSGLEYTGRFLGHYGIYGIGFVASFLFFKKLPGSAKTVLLFAVGYVLYVTVIGGDVLKVHRFFLPVFGPTAIVMVIPIWMLVRRLQATPAAVIGTICLIALSSLVYFMPYGYIQNYFIRERALTDKMGFLASEMKRSDATDFSVALPTIGIFGYTLLNHRIIDMLGLTDSTIALHSEPPVPGMQTTWKEAKHNSVYILSQAPDYIVFSTGGKPSAPAERALLLYEEFINSYRLIGWPYRSTPGSRTNLLPAYKQMYPITGPIIQTHPVSYVQYYTEGLNRMVSGDYRVAERYLQQAIDTCPDPINLSLLCDKAFCHTLMGEHDIAVGLLDRALSIDSNVFLAHKDLYVYAGMANDAERLRLHRRWLEKLAPWYLNQ